MQTVAIREHHLSVAPVGSLIARVVKSGQKGLLCVCGLLRLHALPPSVEEAECMLLEVLEQLGFDVLAAGAGRADEAVM